MFRRSPSSIILLITAAMLLAPASALRPAEAAVDPLQGEIIMFAGNFAPRGWALCNGQILAVSQNAALFSLLGTTYGGDGRISFGLPDLRGRVAMHPGRGPGVTARRLGEKGGTETVTLTEAQIPSHTHAAKATVRATSTAGNQKLPTGHIPAGGGAQYSDTKPNVAMGATMVEVANAKAGGGQAHTNMPPFLTVNFIIALKGTYPSRN
jgi:microcystin-dependent protein